MRTASSTNNQSFERASGVPSSDPNRAAFALSIAIGAALGVLLGLMSMAGLYAVVIGVVVGAICGAVVGKLTIARLRRQSARDRVLDREIGVIDGDIGSARRT